MVAIRCVGRSGCSANECKTRLVLRLDAFDEDAYSSSIMSSETADLEESDRIIDLIMDGFALR